MTDQERANRFGDQCVGDQPLLATDEKQALAEEFSATRLDERRAIAAWIRSQVGGWGRSTVRTVAQQIADRVERGEHGS